MLPQVGKVDDARTMLLQYDMGLYTHQEVVAFLIQGAANTAPAELAQALSETWLGEIREGLSDFSESSLDDIFVTFVQGDDPEASIEEQHRLWHEGARRWREFFD